VAVTAERAFLAGVEGNCQIPIAGHATVSGGMLSISGMIAAIDGSTVLRDRLAGPGKDAAKLGSELAARLLEAGGRTILDSIGKH
jgi:hydroxymethylbilane synthase